MRVKMIVSVTTGDGFFVASGTSTDLFTDEEAEDLVREGKAVAYRNERPEANPLTLRAEDARRIRAATAHGYGERPRPTDGQGSFKDEAPGFKPKQRSTGRANS